MDPTMKLPHHDTPTPLDLDDLRKRNAAARQLLQEWLADASGYDEETWPLLQERQRTRAEGMLHHRLTGSFASPSEQGIMPKAPTKEGVCHHRCVLCSHRTRQRLRVSRGRRVVWHRGAAVWLSVSCSLTCKRV